MPPEGLQAKKSRAQRILALLEQAYPDAKIALHFNNPLELLVATILSAQCTDERVNQVTASLFKKYRTAKEYAETGQATFEAEIHSTGFYKAKARSIIGMARALLERHRGRVPETLDELVELPGVGRKTANVVLGNAFGQDALAVDTHVFRVSQRLGLAKSDDPDKIEAQLTALIPRSHWTAATHLLITHGRRTCYARKPDCPGCAVRALCPWPEKTATGRVGKVQQRPRRR